jgi:3-oxoacyl-[acyl-carrier protein] reductase
MSLFTEVPIELTGLTGRVAIVTGAARMRGIGRAIAVALARSGCDVVVTGTSRPADTYPPDEQAVGWRGLASVADEIAALGRRCLTVTTDRMDDAAADALVSQTISELGHVDILVNNAAASRGADRVPVVELATDVWRNVIEVNLHGTFLLSRAAARAMIAQAHGGSIVNISSIGGKLMGARTAAYAASKAAVQALTSAMAQEIGAHGIRVNAVCPGIVRTTRLDDQTPDQWAQIIAARVPMRRAGEVEEIASIVVYLCSEHGAWITGQAWNIDGGQLTIR